MAGVWRKTLVYLGLVEDDELDEYAYEDYEQTEAEPRSQRRGREPQVRREATVTAIPTSPAGKLHVVKPTSFNDVQEVGDKFREGFSVIMNLEPVDDRLARRLMDFAGGLVYALHGHIEPITPKVYLLTPSGVQVSAEELRQIREERGFFSGA